MVELPGAAPASVIGGAVAINASGKIAGVLDGHAALGGDNTQGDDNGKAVAVNAAGDVVGMSMTSAGLPRAFIWRNGIMTDLGTLGGDRTTVAGRHALNDAGQVVGTSRDALGRDRAFIWQLGVLRDLGTLGGPSSTGAAINQAGIVVGNSTNVSASARGFFVTPGLCTP
jgi:probable HAF family extracellular repeat protein